MPLYLIRFDNNEEHISSLLKPTVINAYDNPFKLWLVLIISLLYTICAYYYIYLFTRKVKSISSIDKQLQTKNLTSKFDRDIARHTIHIRGINQSLSLNDVKKIIYTFFDQHLTQSVASIQIIPNYDVLTSLLERKFVYQSKLEEYIHHNNANPLFRKKIKVYNSFCTCFPKLIDAEVHYRHWCKIIDNMINFYRNLNIKKNTGNAFICFKSPRIVDNILSNPKIIFDKMNGFEGTLLNIKNWIIKRAPSPSDILWDNIKYSKKWRTIRMISFTIALFIICLIIITPNVINDELSPIIADISNQITDQYTRNIINEYSYTLIVVLMNSLIIPFVVGYIAMFELHYKRSYREKSIFVKNVVFMLVNCFIIPTFGVLNVNKMKSYIKYLLNSGWDWDVSEALVRNTYFFMRYIIQVTFISNGIQLLALPQFFVRKFRVFLAKTDYEKFYASLIKKYFDYGYHYSFSITVFILTLCFSSTIPLIAPFGSLFFIMKYFIDKYNLLFVYPAEFESHGNIFGLVVKFNLLGIFFFQFIISNLFIKIFHEKDYAIYATLLYIVVSIFIYYAMMNVFITKIGDNDHGTIFDKLLSKVQFKKFVDWKELMEQNINGHNDVNRRLIVNDSNSRNNNCYEDTLSEKELINIMKEAYVHPVEKTRIVNPIQIWNDSYNFMKAKSERNSIRTSVNSDSSRTSYEYEDYIKIIDNHINTRSTYYVQHYTK